MRFLVELATATAFLSLNALQAQAAAGPDASSPDGGKPLLPYVYTKWKQFTTKEGLPNDHIFAVKVDGPLVWVGTEDGLARIDKRTGQIKAWKEADGLPWRVVTALAVDPKTGDLWIGLFGGGLARFSGGRFDHWNQMNSGLVNDVVYGIALQDDNVWVATTAGCSRLNVKTGEWTVFTEKNAPMEEIWNYGVDYNDGKVHLAVWGSGVLEYDVANERWKEYLDPDGEMEIDLYRDDGIVHVITTGASYVEKVLWVSTYFGVSRYDGRHWRGFFSHESGNPSDFNNNLKARSAYECWFCSDKGLGACMDSETDTWVNYTRDLDGKAGIAEVKQGGQTIEVVRTGVNVPQNFIISADIDGDDVWIGTGKGLAWGVGEGYYPRLKERPLHAANTVSTSADIAAPAAANSGGLR
jgi:ligand-binding sensor domain-containing protein